MSTKMISVTELDFYDPRCHSCHIAFDDTHAKAWKTRRAEVI